MKTQRHSAILKIISSKSVRTQQQLSDILTGMGIPVTQATLSRDMRELGLIKDGEFYKTPEKSLDELPALFRDSVTGIDHAMNTAVVKCRAGTAMAVCALFDEMKYGKAVGTLAGDDTIFILMRSEKDAAAFVKEMKGKLSFRKKGDDNA